MAVKSALLGTRHPRKEKEAALQNVIGEPACLCGEITMCHTTGAGTKNLHLKWKSVAHKPAGSPHLRASQDLLPGAPTKRGASYQSYLERPTNPTSRGRGVHTYIPRLQDHMKIKLKRGAPAMGTPLLRPLQIAASASNGAQTRSGRTYT